MRRLLLVCLLGACATAGKDQPATDGSMTGDAAMIDAPPDAPAPCTEIVTELLKNPAFDSSPMGTLWMQTPIDPAFPLITGDGAAGGPGIAEQSAPYQAWLGGLPKAGVTTTDVLWQDVVIPARTRLINLSGFYDLRTGDPSATAVDTCSVAWVTTADAPIATVIALDNLKKTTTFTTLNYGLSNAETYSGMTLRLRLTSSNNPQLQPPPGNQGSTSCFFDTFSVKATHCMP
jgi:hypothetical protein